MKRNAIALMITLLFVISISVAIGIGLKQVKDASNSVNDESFMIESSVIVDDVLKLLTTNKELDMIVKASAIEDRRDALAIFLAQSAFIPFESSGIKVIIQIESARKKFNPNMLVDENATLHSQRVAIVSNYITSKGVESEYVDLLLDAMSGVRDDGSYRSELFVKEPTLFRDYIADEKHLQKINDSFMQIFHTNTLKAIKFEELFYLSKERNISIDLNQATQEVWSMMLGVESERAELLVENEGSYASLEDIQLTPEEKVSLAHFSTSFYEPFLDVKVEILKGDKNVKIGFEYDLTKKKGSHFIYELQ